MNESTANYIAELQQLSNRCKFLDLEDILRDWIVCVVRDQVLQNCLFDEEPTLTFKKAFNMVFASEMAQRNVTESQSAVINSEAMYNNTKNNIHSFKH